MADDGPTITPGEPERKKPKRNNAAYMRAYRKRKRNAKGAAKDVPKAKGQPPKPGKEQKAKDGQKERPPLPDVLTEILKIKAEARENKGGRPTAYTQEAGPMLVAIMRKGYSISAAAGALGVSRHTIYEWARNHPEFADSLELARNLRLFKLETDLLAAPDGPLVNARKFALANASKHEWGGVDDPNAAAPEMDPLTKLARELAGTALRPRELPAPEAIEVEYEVVPNDQQQDDEPPPRPMGES